MANRITAKEHWPTWCCGEAVRRSRQIMRKREKEAAMKYDDEAEGYVEERCTVCGGDSCGMFFCFEESEDK